MALCAVSPSSRLVGLALPLALLMSQSSDSRRFDCTYGNHVVGRAVALSPASGAPIRTDWGRLDRLTAIAREVDADSCDWRVVAYRLTNASRELGCLSPMDAYWLGTSWWAYHQPAKHLKYPTWAPRAALDPNLALRHPEGGNCESSANGHAALLTYLGVPSRTVYGHLLPSGEGHVWTISDVGGIPMAADVHIARVPEALRESGLPWRPSPAQIQSTPSYAAALRFATLHTPEDPHLSPVSP